MSMPRAILVLLCLSAFAPAVPAPFPRERKAADARGWSEPAGGLRIRLRAHRTRYRAGEPIRLTLEIQNVSGSALTLAEPDLHPCVAARRVPGWAIIRESHGKGREEEEIDRLRRRNPWHRLGAGETLRVEIAAKGGEWQEKVKGDSDAESPQYLHFTDGETPGVYDLRATFTPDPQQRTFVRKGVWAGYDLTSPPVRIVLEK